MLLNSLQIVSDFLKPDTFFTLNSIFFLNFVITNPDLVKLIPGLNSNNKGIFQQSIPSDRIQQLSLSYFSESCRLVVDFNAVEYKKPDKFHFGILLKHVYV